MTEIANAQRQKKRQPPKMGIRHYVPARDLEVRQEADDGSVTFSGYGVLFDDPTEIRDFFGSFTEVFKRGAFLKTISERGPQGNGQIKLLRGHDAFSAIAARYLSLEEDARGLRFEAETIGTTTGFDLAAELRAGVIDTMSIGFDAIREEYDSEEEKRTVLEARLYEISAVPWPAYEGAKIDSVRAFERLPEYLEALLQEIREGKVLSNANFARLTEARDLIDGVIQSAQPEPAEEPLEEDALDIEFALREAELNLNERK